MVKDSNENNLNHKGEKPEDSPQMKKYQQEKREAIDAAKKMELELAQKLEDHESHRETQETQELMHKNDFPEVRPGRNDNPEQEELQRMFEAIKTDHIEYNFLRRIIPSFVKKMESSRLGDNFLVDILWIPGGGVESVASTAKLSGHMLVDLGELFVQPKVAYERTKSLIS